MNIEYKFVEAAECIPFFSEHRSKVFSNDFDFDIGKALSDEEKQKRKNHFSRLKDTIRLYLVAKSEGQIIAWSFGIQKSADDYYMINSAVLEGYRQEGIYTKMLEKTVEKLTEIGFQRIYSLHKMSNNAILIAKLKFGFMITGFEVTDTFGNLVELSYYTNPIRRELLEVRMGSRKLSDDKRQFIV